MLDNHLRRQKRHRKRRGSTERRGQIIDSSESNQTLHWGVESEVH